MPGLLVITSLMCVVMTISLPLQNSEAAKNFSETIDGSIGSVGCSIVGGSVENVSVIEEREDMNIDVCKYRNLNLQITPLHSCPAEVGTWSDPETGQNFTFGASCEEPLMPLPNCGRPVRVLEYDLQRYSLYYNEMVRNEATAGKPYYFQIGLDNAYTSCTNWSFDPAEKRLEIDLSSHLGQSKLTPTMNITIPYALLSGKFKVLINGTETSDTQLIRNANSDTLKMQIPLTNTDNSVIFKVEILGTEAVPEFSVIYLLLATTFSIPIMLVRLITQKQGRI